jgi:hypothetical protein
VGVDQESLFDCLPEPGHGVVLKEPQDPDKLPESLSFSFLLPLETTAKGVKTLGQVQIRQGPGMIQGTRLSFQKRQIVTVVEEDPFLAPGSRMLGYYLFLVA